MPVVGEITSVTILPVGWQADVTIFGLNVGGTYKFGLGPNDDPATGSPIVVFNVTSLGFDDTGTPIAVTRQVYGTHAVRQAYNVAFPLPYPNEESFAAGAVTIRIALNDYIYAKDILGAGFVPNVSSGVAPVVAIGDELYNQGGNLSITTGVNFPVTNNSAAVFQKVVGNFSYPGFDAITGNFNLRAVLFHRHGQSGRPIRVVNFTVADTSAHVSPNKFVTVPTYDAGMGDAVPVVEYVGLIDVSGLTALNILTAKFVAYPWIGDTSSILDTSAGTAQPTPLVGPITFLNDKSATYGRTYALVDPAGSDAGANTVYDSAVFNPVTAYKFLTIGKAAAAIAAYNNANHARNDVGGGIVFLNDGNYNFAGSANAYGVSAAAWFTVKRAATSTSRSAVVINGQSGDLAIGTKLKWEDLTFTSAAVSTVSNQTQFWTHNCTINSTGLAPVYQATNWYITNCTIPQYTANLSQFGGENMSVALLRGCNLTGFVGVATIYTVLGNLKTDTSICFFQENSAAGPPLGINGVFAFNRITSAADTTNFIVFSNTNATGLAVVQNVLENCNNTQPLLWIGGDGNLNTINNAIVWHNTLSGQRRNAAYNDAGAAAVSRSYWSDKNNIYEQDNIKTDTYTVGPNAARIGNWSQLYGVGASGNFDCEVVGGNLGAGGAFCREFAGLKCYRPAVSYATQPVTSGTNPITFVGFINRQSRTQGAAGLGNGNYRLATTSPARLFTRDFILAVDIAGLPRVAIDNAGAYADPVSGNKNSLVDGVATALTGGILYPALLDGSPVSKILINGVSA